MSRDPALYLEDILEACRRIRILTEGQDLLQFTEDWAVRDAVLRNLEGMTRFARDFKHPTLGPDAVPKPDP